MGKPKVLTVLSSHATGWYLPEFAHPYEVLAPETELVTVSPKGGATIVDPTSIQLYKDDAYSIEFLNTKQKTWTETEKLEKYVGRAKEFAAILYVGGFGPMWDIAEDATSIKLIREFYDSGLIVATVCHGSIALAHVKLDDGSYLIDGEKVTGFSNEEVASFNSNFEEIPVPYHLEDALEKSSGGNYEKAGAPWESKVIVSSTKKLITGENPASAKPLAVELLKMIKASA
ncbi:putative glutathione-independent glyoxalase [Lachnellula hyalina]|uniref:D-lactate dehydratase n=1 Tax=Lachnellula hyalina TaxID=1316788 RepID=A0A8H8R4G4_9HELO|nr:putative glutathione-independent glyoxalase [Lachnellula hyalina]TVY27545.1 putative glutathione-independent glyoxalase [Lachnellula hyalina]